MRITASTNCPAGPWKRVRQAETWDDFVAWLDLENPAAAKECGGYVGGTLSTSRQRTEATVVSRSILTLDADHARPGLIADVSLEIGCAGTWHTTWSHTPDAPRYRLLLPLSRDVTPEEYWRLAHVLMVELDGPEGEQFDHTCAEAERFMWRPAAPDGDAARGGYVHGTFSGPLLDVEEWLGIADDREIGGRHDADTDRLTTGDYLGPVRSAEEGRDPRAARWISEELAKLDDLAEEPWYEGAGWDITTFKVACDLIRYANSPWTGYTLDEAEADLAEHAPADGAWGAAEHAAKWKSALRDAGDQVRDWPGPVPGASEDFADPVSGGMVDLPPGPDVVEALRDDNLYDENSLTDGHLGERIVRQYLGGRFLAWGNRRWALWDGRRWDIECSGDTVAEAVLLALRKVAVHEIARADRARDKALRKAEERGDATKPILDGHAKRMGSIAGLSSNGKIRAVMAIVRSFVQRSLSDFDAENTHHLLNVANGVVDLRTGELTEHDPALMFTQVSRVAYVVGAEHPDWKKALTALPDEVADWMQVRFGQAATGKATADDVVPFLQGGGENGKTTVLLGVKKALGEFCIPVPEKVLLGSPSDHSTELFALKGVRLALIEELPEGDWLNASRLKRVSGTETGITARAIGENNVTWEPSHSLMVTTNYRVQIGAADHGTWRRLALVRFPFSFDGKGSPESREKDDTLRDRLRDGEDGQHEAVLAWLVEGAKMFYTRGLERERDTPAVVKADTETWRTEGNGPITFLNEVLVRDDQAAVRSSDVYRMFCRWNEERGAKKLTDQTFWNRASGHLWLASGEVKRGYARTSGWTVSVMPGDPEPKESERLLQGVRFDSESPFYGVL